MENESENIDIDDIDDTDRDMSSNSVPENRTVCYCGGNLDSGMLKCSVCNVHFHIVCLKNGRPSNLKGDVFFDFTCVKCSEVGFEKCLRRQMNWLQVVYLALYNLICNGSGRRGYFRWKDDLCQFIEANWATFHGDRKRTSSWRSTVAGILSTNCPKYFKNGQKQFREVGWWTLQDVLPPSEKLEVSATGMTARRRKRNGGGQTGEVKKTRSSERKKTGKEKTVTLEEIEEVLDKNESLVEVDDVDGFEGFLKHSAELLELDIGDVDPMENIFDDLEEATNASLTSSFAEANITERYEIKSEKSETKSENSLSAEPLESQGVIVLDPEEMSSTQSLTKSSEPCKRGKQATGQVAVQAQQLRAMHPHEEQIFLNK